MPPEQKTVEKLPRVHPSDRPDEIAEKLNRREELRAQGVNGLEPVHGTPEHRQYTEALNAERAARAKAAGVERPTTVAGDTRARSADSLYDTRAGTPANAETLLQRSGFDAARGEVNAA